MAVCLSLPWDGPWQPTLVVSHKKGWDQRESLEVACLFPHDYLRVQVHHIRWLLAVLHCWCCPLGRGIRLLEPRARCVPVTSISGGTTEGLSSEGLVDSQSSASKHWKSKPQILHLPKTNENFTCLKDCHTNWTSTSRSAVLVSCIVSWLQLTYSPGILSEPSFCCVWLLAASFPV